MGPVLTLTLNPALDIETTVDRVTPVRKLRSGAARYDCGGGGINVARVVTRLGGRAGACFTAGGPIGQYLDALIRGEGVATRPVPIAGTTRPSFTALETASGQQYRFVLAGPDLSAAEAEASANALIVQAGRKRHSGPVQSATPGRFDAPPAAGLTHQSGPG